MASNGAVCLSKIHYLCLSSGILKQEENRWEDRETYIRLADTGSKDAEADKAYPSYWNILGIDRLSVRNYILYCMYNY